MKNPFQNNPDAALDKTKAKLASVEDNIASLKAKRAELLLTAEDASAVVTIDKAIDAETANAQIYRDRIRALQEECRRVLYQQREAERTKAIARVKAKLGKREIVAVQLQETIERVGELYSELMSQDEAALDWPFSRPGHGFAQIDKHSVDRECSWLLYGITKQHRVPEPGSVGLGVTGITAQGIAAVVGAQNESILLRLETVPIAEDLLDEAS